MSRRTTAYVLLLLVSIIWGAASPVVKHTLAWFNPWLFLTYRFLVSTLVAIPFFTISKHRLPQTQSDLWLLLACSITSAPIALVLFFEALNKTTALSGSLITAAGPLFLILGGVLLFRDRVTRNEKIGIGIAVAGTLFTVVGPLIMNGHSDSLGRLEGNMIMLLAVISDVAGALLCDRAIHKGMNPLFITHVQFVIGLFIMLPLLLIQQTPADIAASVLSAPLEAHLGVLYMALISGTFAYSIRNIAIISVEISEVAVFNYMQPLWAAILSVVWLQEVVTPSYTIGGIFIAIGVIIAQQHGNRKR